MTALTPEAATQILRNGGAYKLNNGDLIWFDGELNRVIEDKGSRRLPLDLRKIEHPDYPAHVFARTYPCKLPGHEAKALIMQAPVGMLKGQYTKANWPREDNWGYRRQDGSFLSGGWRWNNDPFTVRLRHGWLEKQREKFASMKGEEMEPETLTGWRALKAMEEGRVLESLTSQTVVRIEDGLLEEKTSGGWVRSNSTVHWLISARFKILPDAPTHIDVPLSCGLTARCEADVVKVDVPDCAVWEVKRERAELAQKLAGLHGVIIEGFAQKPSDSRWVYIHSDALRIESRAIPFSELYACLAAMDKVKGGGNG
jgi:hypothetical protein